MVGEVFRSMVLCLVPAAVGVIISAQDQPSRTPEQRVTKNRAGSTDENTRAISKDVGNAPNVTVIVKQENPTSHKPDETKDDENIAIQRKLANFTLWLVVVGAIQAGILASTIGAIVNQTAVNRNTVRAWVMVDVEHDAAKWASAEPGKVHTLVGAGMDGDTTAFYSVLVCRNEGKSPAWISEIKAKFEIVTSLPSIPDMESPGFVEFGPIPLGTGVVSHTERLEWPAEARGHPERGKMRVVYGVVKYRDIFNKHRQTTFGYRITIDEELKRLTEQRYRQYNENT